MSGAGLVLLLGSACAEVTQSEPESYLDDAPGTGGRATGAAGSSAASNRGGASGGGAPAAGGGAPGGSAGQGGSAGRGGSADPIVQLPSGMELFREDFEAEDVSRWTTAGGQWARSLDGETDSNVFGQSASSASDVLLAVAGDVSWGDVRVEADFKVLAFNGSSSSYLAGVCVRVADAENFYAVALRGDSNRHIGIRRFGSSDTNLGQSDFSGAENVWYHLRVDAIGSTLSVYVDGTLVLEQTDAEHPSGGIGLCTTRASAVFDNIVVTAP